jgi:hypothetical protein
MKLFRNPALPLLAATLAVTTMAHAQTEFTRPPAFPLVTHDPYFSTWSMSDTLTQSWPRHWTGATMGMCGLVRIDGHPYRWCGMAPQGVPELQQKSVTIQRTSTIYRYEAADRGVALSIEFGSPIGLEGDALAASRPVSYIRARASSLDGQAHDVRVYVDFSGEWVVKGHVVARPPRRNGRR